MSLRQRDPRQHDEAHLAFVRTRQCCIPYCKRQAEAAHIRMGCQAIGKELTGMAEKPHDKWTCPLCPYHHRIGAGSQHSMGEADFWSLMGLNPFAIAAELWIASGGAEREAAPRLPAKPSKIKARKPREQRRKVPVGRKIQSNPVIQARAFDKSPAKLKRPLTIGANFHLQALEKVGSYGEAKKEESHQERRLDRNHQSGRLDRRHLDLGAALNTGGAA